MGDGQVAGVGHLHDARKARELLALAAGSAILPRAGGDKRWLRLRPCRHWSVLPAAAAHRRRRARSATGRCCVAAGAAAAAALRPAGDGETAFDVHRVYLQRVPGRSNSAFMTCVIRSASVAGHAVSPSNRRRETMRAERAATSDVRVFTNDLQQAMRGPAYDRTDSGCSAAALRAYREMEGGPRADCTRTMEAERVGAALAGMVPASISIATMDCNAAGGGAPKAELANAQLPEVEDAHDHCRWIRHCRGQSRWDRFRRCTSRCAMCHSRPPACSPAGSMARSTISGSSSAMTRCMWRREITQRV